MSTIESKFCKLLIQVQLLLTFLFFSENVLADKKSDKKWSCDSVVQSQADINRKNSKFEVVENPPIEGKQYSFEVEFKSSEGKLGKELNRIEKDKSRRIFTKITGEKTFLHEATSGANTIWNIHESDVSSKDGKGDKFIVITEYGIFPEQVSKFSMIFGSMNLHMCHPK